MYSFAFPSENDREKRLVFLSPEQQDNTPKPYRPLTTEDLVQRLEKNADASKQEESESALEKIRVDDVTDVERQADTLAEDAGKQTGELEGLMKAHPEIFFSKLVQGLQDLFEALFGKKKTETLKQDIDDPAEIETPTLHPLTQETTQQMLQGRYNVNLDVSRDALADELHTLSVDQLENALFQVRRDIQLQQDEIQTLQYEWDKSYNQHKRRHRDAVARWGNRRRNPCRLSKNEFMKGKGVQLQEIQHRYGDVNKLFWALVHEWGGRKDPSSSAAERRKMWSDYIRGAIQTDEKQGGSIRAKVLQDIHKDYHRYDGVNAMSERMAREEKAREEQWDEWRQEHIHEKGFNENQTIQTKRKFWAEHGHAEPTTSRGQAELAWMNIDGDLTGDRQAQEHLEKNREMKQATYQETEKVFDAVHNLFRDNLHYKVRQDTSRNNLDVGMGDVYVQTETIQGDNSSFTDKYRLRVEQNSDGGFTYSVINLMNHVDHQLEKRAFSTMQEAVTALQSMMRVDSQTVPDATKARGQRRDQVPPIPAREKVRNPKPQTAEVPEKTPEPQKVPQPSIEPSVVDSTQQSPALREQHNTATPLKQYILQPTTFGEEPTILYIKNREQDTYIALDLRNLEDAFIRDYEGIRITRDPHTKDVVVTVYTPGSYDISGRYLGQGSGPTNREGRQVHFVRLQTDGPDIAGEKIQGLPPIPN